MRNHWISDKPNIYCAQIDDENFFVFSVDSVAEALNQIESLIGTDEIESLLVDGMNIQNCGGKIYFVDARVDKN